MKTELKDVIHLYLGCEIECEKSNYKLSGIVNPDKDSEDEEFWVYAENEHHGEKSFDIEDCKLILRPLSDMTNDEVEYVGLVLKQGTWNAPDIRLNPDMAWSIHHLRPKTFIYLIKQGFDLFGLIESGQAIDKTKWAKLQ